VCAVESMTFRSRQVKQSVGKDMMRFLKNVYDINCCITFESSSYAVQ